MPETLRQIDYTGHVPTEPDQLAKLRDTLASLRAGVGVQAVPLEDASPEYFAGWIDGMLNAAQITIQNAIPA